MQGFVLPFPRVPREDPVLGPEMKSTGELMGVSPRFQHAFSNVQLE